VGRERRSLEAPHGRADAREGGCERRARAREREECSREAARLGADAREGGCDQDESVEC